MSWHFVFWFFSFSFSNFGNATESFPNYYLASLFLFMMYAYIHFIRRCQLETFVIPFRVTLLKIGVTWLPTVLSFSKWFFVHFFLYKKRSCIGGNELCNACIPHSVDWRIDVAASNTAISWWYAFGWFKFVVNVVYFFCSLEEQWNHQGKPLEKNHCTLVSTLSTTN